MKFGARKSKPKTEMELSVTFSLPPGLSVAESSERLCAFLEGIKVLSHEIGSAWISMKLSNLPPELEPKLEAARLEYEEIRMPCRLVIDNTQ